MNIYERPQFCGISAALRGSNPRAEKLYKCPFGCRSTETLSCRWGPYTFDSWVRAGLTGGVTLQEAPENGKAMQMSGEVVKAEDTASADALRRV